MNAFGLRSTDYLHLLAPRNYARGWFMSDCEAIRGRLGRLHRIWPREEQNWACCIRGTSVSLLAWTTVLHGWILISS